MHQRSLSLEFVKGRSSSFAYFFWIMGERKTGELSSASDIVVGRASAACSSSCSRVPRSTKCGKLKSWHTISFSYPSTLDTIIIHELGTYTLHPASRSTGLVFLSTRRSTGTPSFARIGITKRQWGVWEKPEGWSPSCFTYLSYDLLILFCAFRRTRKLI